MAIVEVKNNNPVEAIQELLRSMLDKGLVSGILVPQEIPSKKTVVQTLVRESSELKSANPLAPVFSVNSARIIAKMCIAQLAKAPVESEQCEHQKPAGDEDNAHMNDQSKDEQQDDSAPAEVQPPRTEAVHSEDPVTIPFRRRTMPGKRFPGWLILF